jgi:hypothetical protein
VIEADASAQTGEEADQGPDCDRPTANSDADRVAGDRADGGKPFAAR